jgi:hypothetical protein
MMALLTPASAADDSRLGIADDNALVFGFLFEGGGIQLAEDVPFLTSVPSGTTLRIGVPLPPRPLTSHFTSLSPPLSISPCSRTTWSNGPFSTRVEHRLVGRTSGLLLLPHRPPGIATTGNCRRDAQQHDAAAIDGADR